MTMMLNFHKRILKDLREMKKLKFLNNMLVSCLKPSAELEIGDDEPETKASYLKKFKMYWCYDFKLLEDICIS
jgi:hypothetical protein